MLAFELGEIYAALLEMKSARIEDKLEQDAGGCLSYDVVVSSRTTCHLCGCRAHVLTLTTPTTMTTANAGYRPSKAEALKCDEYCNLAIRAFEHFVGLYQQSTQPQEEEGKEEGGLAPAAAAAGSDTASPSYSFETKVRERDGQETKTPINPHPNMSTHHVHPTPPHQSQPTHTHPYYNTNPTPPTNPNPTTGGPPPFPPRALPPRAPPGQAARLQQPRVHAPGRRARRARRGGEAEPRGV